MSYLGRHGRKRLQVAVRDAALMRTEGVNVRANLLYGIAPRSPKTHGKGQVPFSVSSSRVFSVRSLHAFFSARELASAVFAFAQSCVFFLFSCFF